MIGCRTRLDTVDNEGHSKALDDFIHQHVRHSISTFVLNWKCLGPFTEVVGDDENKTSRIDAFKVNGNPITNKKDIVNEFCQGHSCV